MNEKYYILQMGKQRTVINKLTGNDNHVLIVENSYLKELIKNGIVAF